MLDDLYERDRRSCMQAGSRGPPFVPYLHDGKGITWLPTHWFSLAGSNWCYRAEWDELVRCAGSVVPPDWNGVMHTDASYASMLSMAALLVAPIFTAALAFYIAYAEHRSHRKMTAAQLGESSDQGASMCAWLLSKEAVPWSWEMNARWAGGGAILGLIVAFLLPLK